jgi:hypothetical protein
LASSLAAEILGEPLFQAFAAVRRFEWDLYRHSDPGEVAEQLRWRYG